MYRLCNPYLVNPRSRNPSDVCRTNGLRGIEFCPEKAFERRTAEADARERIRDAIFTCPVRGILLAELGAVLAFKTHAKAADSFTYASQYGTAYRAIRASFDVRRIGGLEQDISELSYPEAGARWLHSRLCDCYSVVPFYSRGEEGWLACLDLGATYNKTF